ncbi:hypothetical protein NLI96_g3733 [Meripilus lineatus]|uniref:Uncharacterized protein n=1 Tax=Meripilus lineatus TaxID=2056292 RepID=A0AAD5V8B9_9APHY|nr:hypothetical protein NLI96_g3733 [Physisporinus lineatus]
MKLIAVFAALVSVMPSALGQALTINTLASVVQCQPVKFTWSGGVPPYFLSLLPAGQPAAAAIKQFPTQQGTEYSWTVDLAAGSTFSTSLKDSTGAVAYSDIQTVNSGPDASCLNASVSVSDTAAASATPATGASTTPAAATSPAAGATSATPASSAAAGSSVKAASSAAVSGASSSKASTSASATASANAAVKGSSLSTLGMAGLMGLVGAALF